MAKRGNTLGMTEKTPLGATPDNNGLTTGALVATGVCVAAPTAVVLGSLQTTFVVGGAAATACAYGAHRVANGEPAWPFGDKDKKSDKKKEEVKSSD